jgi:hypothetical protein
MDADALQRTLDAIDAVTTCGWCGATLTADAPSSSYCSEDHQEQWLARNVGAEPVPICDIFEDLRARLIARQSAPAMLFTNTTPDGLPLSFRYLLEQRLAFGVGLGIQSTSVTLRGINIA